MIFLMLLSCRNPTDAETDDGLVCFNPPVCDKLREQQEVIDDLSLRLALVEANLSGGEVGDVLATQNWVKEELGSYAVTADVEISFAEVYAEIDGLNQYMVEVEDTAKIAEETSQDVAKTVLILNGVIATSTSDISELNTELLTLQSYVDDSDDAIMSYIETELDLVNSDLYDAYSYTESVDSRVSVVESDYTVSSDLSEGPIGEVILWMSDMDCPAGYLELDGSTYDPVLYPEVSGILQDAYGYYALPDARGMFLRVADSGAGIDPESTTREARLDGLDGDLVGTTQLDSTAVNDLLIVQDAGHTHSASISTNGSHSHTEQYTTLSSSTNVSAWPNNENVYRSYSYTTTSTGVSGDHSHTATVATDGVHDHSMTGSYETRPENIAVRLCFRVDYTD